MMPQPVKSAMRLAGRRFIREYPYRDAYLLEDALAGPPGDQPADGPARRHHRPPLDGPRDARGLRVRRDGARPAARARSREPHRGGRGDPVAVHPLQPLHADQLRRARTARSSRTAPPAARAWGTPPATPEPRPPAGSRAGRTPRVVGWTTSSTAGSSSSRRGPGEYAANLDAGWVVGGGVNGGYALAVIGNAIRAELIGRGPARPGQRERLLPEPDQARALRSCGCAGCGSAGGAPRSPPAWCRSTRARRWSGSRRSRCTATSTGCRTEVQRQIPPPELPPSRTVSMPARRPRRYAGWRHCWSGSAPASTRRTSAGPSASPAVAASSRAGSSWPTTARWTRSPC